MALSLKHQSFFSIAVWTLDTMCSFKLQLSFCKMDRPVQYTVSVFASFRFVCINEVGERNRIMELTSIPEAAVLSKQTGKIQLRAISSADCMTSEGRVPAVQAAVCHEALHRAKWKIFSGIDEPYSSSSQNLKLHINHITSPRLLFLDLNKQTRRDLNFSDTFHL